MTSFPWISRVSSREPSQRNRERGVVLFGSFRHGLFRIAFTACRAPDACVSIQFPCRGGRPLAWPHDEPSRQLIVEHLIRALRAKGKLP